MKKCMKCGGTHKMQKGGQKIVGMPGYNATTRPMQMKKGGIKKYQPGGPMTQAPTTPPPASSTVTPSSVTTSPSGQQRVMTKSPSQNNFNKVVGSAEFVKRGGVIKPTYKKGGSTKNAKLAALAAPKNKITRADVIAGALKNKRKKK